MSIEYKNTLLFENGTDYRCVLSAITAPGTLESHRVDFERLIPVPDCFGYPSEGAREAMQFFVHNATLKHGQELDGWAPPSKHGFTEDQINQLIFGHKVPSLLHHLGSRRFIPARFSPSCTGFFVRLSEVFASFSSRCGLRFFFADFRAFCVLVEFLRRFHSGLPQFWPKGNGVWSTHLAHIITNKNASSNHILKYFGLVFKRSKYDIQFQLRYYRITCTQLFFLTANFSLISIVIPTSVTVMPIMGGRFNKSSAAVIGTGR